MKLIQGSNLIELNLQGRGVNGRRGGGYSGNGHAVGAFASFLKEDPASRSRHLEHEVEINDLP